MGIFNGAVQIFRGRLADHGRRDADTVVLIGYHDGSSGVENQSFQPLSFHGYLRGFDIFCVVIPGMAQDFYLIARLMECCGVLF